MEPQAEPKPKGTPLNPLRGVLGDKTLEDVIEREAKEEQDTSSPFSLSRTLGGVLISRFVKRQMGVVLLISVFILIYISLRYMSEEAGRDRPHRGKDSRCPIQGNGVYQ